MKALLALSLAFTLLASPVYALDFSCTTIDEIEENESSQVQYDNWTHVNTIILSDDVTLEVFDSQKDVDGLDEILVAGIFIKGCWFDNVNNSFNPTRQQIEEFLDFLNSQEQQLNTGFNPVKYTI
jgi:hypothetical protein